MKKSTTVRSLLACGLSMLLCLSMLAGTTFAWFTDSVESGTNQIVAGNLDVELYNSIGKDADKKIDESTKLFNMTLWEPGAMVYENLTVANEGTLALKYQLGVNVANATPNANGDTLAKVLKVAVVKGGIENKTREDLKTLDYTSLASFIKAGKLEAGANETYGIVIWWEPSDIDNEFNMNNGKTGVMSIDIGVKLLATQATAEAEKDSFGNDYDADATVDGFEVVDADSLQTAINNGETAITLVDNIVLDAPIVIPATPATYSARSNAVVIDLNGKTITGNMHKNDGSVIKNQGTLILKNGTIKSAADNGGSALVNNGTAVLENVTLNGAPNANGSWPSYTVNNTGVLEATNVKITSFHGSVASYGEGALVTLNDCEIDMAGIPGFTNHGIYTYDSGAVVVNGGEYVNHAADQGATGGSVINGNVTINGGTFIGRIENYYGTPVIKGGNFSEAKNNFVADGYKSVNVGNVYYVVASDINVAYDADTLKAALANGGNTIVVNDIEIAKNETITIANGKTAVVDLNGFEITSTADKSGNQELFLVKGNLTVKNGAITYTASNNQGWNAMIAIFDVTAGGALVMDEVEASVSGSDMNFVAHLNNWGSASAEITNCDFDLSYVAVRAFNSGYDMNTVTIKNTNVTGGARLFWVHNYTSEGASDATLTLDIYNNNNTSEHATPVRFGFSNSSYYDLEGKEFVTEANIADALANGGSVILADDVKIESATTAPYGNKYAVALNGGILDGNGNELYMECYGDDYGVMTTGGTIKNVTITEGCRAIMIMFATEDIIIDNAHIGGDGVLYPINTGEYAKAEGVDLIVSNSTLAGWTSYAGIASATFTNVKFEQGTYYNNIYGRVFKPYVNTTLTDCSFIEHMNLDLSGLVEGQKVTFVNCTVNGQAVTADVFTIPTTDAQYDTELFTVDLPAWADSIDDCVIFN